MHAIGIDIGTTSICGVVIDTATGAVKASKTVDSNAFIKTDKLYEKIQSAEKIIALAKSILDELITDQIGVIGVTGQMHGIVYHDKFGKPVSPLYTWQDGRGDLPYKNTTYAGFLGSHTGYGNVTDFYNREKGLVPENAVNYCPCVVRLQKSKLTFATYSLLKIQNQMHTLSYNWHKRSNGRTTRMLRLL